MALFFAVAKDLKVSVVVQFILKITQVVNKTGLQFQPFRRSSLASIFNAQI